MHHESSVTTSEHSQEQRVLIVTSVQAEQEAVQRGLLNNSGFEVIVGGVGVAAAAASTATAIATAGMKGITYSRIVCAGIAGGFAEVAEVGTIVIASEIIAADLGSETAEGFLSVDELGFGTSRYSADLVYAERLAAKIGSAGTSVPKAVLGPVLTVTTATGTAQTADALRLRVPGAAAEGMEGYGIAVAAAQQQIPVLEIRAISNEVGPRNRDAWRIGDALKALQAAGPSIVEVLGR